MAWGWRAETGHASAVYASPSRLDHLGGVQAPTVVLHGTADAIYPLAHGEALAAGISGATLVRLAGAGHTLADQTLGRALRSAHQLAQNA